MIDTPKLLVSHLREQLYESEINGTMNLMMIGPSSHGKTRMLDCILDEPNTLKENDGELFVQ